MAIHPLARRSLAKLRLPEPISRYCPGLTERINTNPFAGEFGLYPSPCPDAHQAAFAAHLTREALQQGRSGTISGKNVLFTAGSVAGIDLLIRAFCEPSVDRICAPRPTFPCYAAYATAGDIEVVDIPLQGPDFNQLDPAKIADADAKLTFLCSPNNPIGSSLDPAQIVQVLESSRGLVVIDEAYVDFSTRPSWPGELAHHPNLVILRTFSKAWGLAGLRVGATLAAPEVLHALRLLQDPYSFHVAAQRAVAAHIEDHAGVRSMVERVRAERLRVHAALAELPVVRRIVPSDTNFLFVELTRPDGVADLLWGEGILASDSSYQVSGSIRISIATPEENDRMLRLVRSLPAS